jgi:beta-1,3-galactosyltransferase 1
MLNRYSPRYMYSGRVYPRYLSGTGYVLSSPTATALYRAALHQNYFHLEDIYITGE